LKAIFFIYFVLTYFSFSIQIPGGSLVKFVFLRHLCFVFFQQDNIVFNQEV